MLLNRKCRNL